MRNKKNKNNRPNTFDYPRNSRHPYPDSQIVSKLKSGRRNIGGNTDDPGKQLAKYKLAMA
jgi:hypothetical protein